MLVLNIGCGYNKNINEIGIDLTKTPYVDIICEIQHLPFKSGAFELVEASHVLEHSNDIIKAFNEIRRVLKVNGTLHGKVPHALSKWYYDNPTHKTMFTIWGLRNFIECDEFQMNNSFKIKEIKLNGRFSRFFSRKLETFEIFIRFVHYNYEIEFWLDKI